MSRSRVTSRTESSVMASHRRAHGLVIPVTATSRGLFGGGGGVGDRVLERRQGGGVQHKDGGQE